MNSMICDLSESISYSCFYYVQFGDRIFSMEFSVDILLALVKIRIEVL